MTYDPESYQAGYRAGFDAGKASVILPLPAPRLKRVRTSVPAAMRPLVSYNLGSELWYVVCLCGWLTSRGFTSVSRASDYARQYHAHQLHQLEEL